ncbi:hypothetical protein [Streptomyces sp. NPDC001546]|uniref:hypothetical protein n=1 Tax=Streptomyces sp. NPDC001546 TaxID=3364585 RepID=UPI0036A3502B
MAGVIITRAELQGQLVPPEGAAKAMPQQPAADASPEDKLKAGLLALAGGQTLITIASYDGKGAEDAFASVQGRRYRVRGRVRGTGRRRHHQAGQCRPGLPPQPR